MIKIYVKDIRKKRKMSIRELAIASDVSKSQLEAIESGNANPTLDTMCKISEALNVPVCDLFRCPSDTRLTKDCNFNNI